MVQGIDGSLSLLLYVQSHYLGEIVCCRLLVYDSGRRVFGLERLAQFLSQGWIGGEKILDEIELLFLITLALGAVKVFVSAEGDGSKDQTAPDDYQDDAENVQRGDENRRNGQQADKFAGNQATSPDFGSDWQLLDDLGKVGLIEGAFVGGAITAD